MPEYNYILSDYCGSIDIGEAIIELSELNVTPLRIPYNETAFAQMFAGIDNAANTIHHELFHYVDFVNFWSNERTTWESARMCEDPACDPDSDILPSCYDVEGLPPFQFEDIQCNGVYEQWIDPFDFMELLTWYAGIDEAIVDDDEERTYRAVRNKGGSHAADWASPGMQHGINGRYDD